MNDSEDVCYESTFEILTERRCNPLTSYRCSILASEMMRPERRLSTNTGTAIYRLYFLDQGDPTAAVLDSKIQSI